MERNDAILRTNGLSKDFGALKAVNNVSLNIGAGVHSIIGPNGAGKTTLFNLITGFLKPTSGEVIFLGEEISNFPPFSISKLGLSRSFQITSIFPNLTVY
jgi:branched-chain amino acid transport system ATP-binding protein